MSWENSEMLNRKVSMKIGRVIIAEQRNTGSVPQAAEWRAWFSYMLVRLLGTVL